MESLERCFLQVTLGQRQVLGCGLLSCVFCSQKVSMGHPGWGKGAEAEGRRWGSWQHGCSAGCSRAASSLGLCSTGHRPPRCLCLGSLCCRFARLCSSWWLLQRSPSPLGTRTCSWFGWGGCGERGEVLGARAMPSGSAPSLATPSWKACFHHLQRTGKLKRTILHAFHPHNCI